MGFAIGSIAVALAGIGATPPADREAAQICYTVRIIDAGGIGWREGVFTRLKPVTRQGAATVWTVSRDTTKRLLADLVKNVNAEVRQAPRITAYAGAAATVFSRHNENLITKVAWDGNESAPKGTREPVRVGWHTTMVGRKLDQGILVKLVFEDTQIRAIHRVTATSEPQAFIGADKAAGLIAMYCGVADSACTDQPACGRATPKPSKTTVIACENRSEVVTDPCTEDQGCCPLTFSELSRRRGIVAARISPVDGVKDRAVERVAIEVPEIGTQEVLGEWLIPHGEFLLVSFGVHTVADQQGKAVVNERLAIIGAEEVPCAGLDENLSGAPVPTPRALHELPATPLAPAPPAKVPMPAPPAPSRSMPQGYHADGTPANLPPLPEGENDADCSDSGSSEPKPSPQTKKPQPAKPATDPGASKAAFTPPRSSTVFLPSVFLARPSVGFQFLLPLSPLSLKLPFNQRLEIEIYGRLVPNTESR
jgi:hypothetical protein